MKRELLKIDQHLQSLVDDFDASGYITQARELALKHGNGEAAKLCRMPHGLISIMQAREVIASMIGMIKDKSTTLSVKQAAQQIKVSQDTIRAWIKNGSLPASQVGSGKSKGRYVIQEKDWLAFLDNRKPEAPAKRKRLQSSFKRY